MTTNHDAARGQLIEAPQTPRWICLLLGLVMLLVSVLVLSDVMLFTEFSMSFIGGAALLTGVFLIVHAFWSKGWAGLLWQIVLGGFYAAFGGLILGQPLVGAFVLTYVLGFVLVFSGLIRVFIGINRWRRLGVLILGSGVFGLAAGLVVLVSFPATGLWMFGPLTGANVNVAEAVVTDLQQMRILGALLGADLLIHGLVWLVYAAVHTKPARENPSTLDDTLNDTPA
jgi:uncharacterized membrane protein HdeD (DUF308 family)